MKFLSSIEGIILAPTAVPTARTEISKKFLFFFLRQFAQKKLNEMKLFGTGQCFKISPYAVIFKGCNFCSSEKAERNALKYLANNFVTFFYLKPFENWTFKS